MSGPRPSTIAARDALLEAMHSSSPSTLEGRRADAFTAVELARKVGTDYPTAYRILQWLGRDGIVEEVRLAYPSGALGWRLSEQAKIARRRLEEELEALITED